MSQNNLRCKICNSHNVIKHTFREMMYGTKEEFDYLECKDCLNLQILEFPKNIAKYYTSPENSEYYSFSDPKKIYGNIVKKILKNFRDNIVIFFTKNKIYIPFFGAGGTNLAINSIARIDSISKKSGILDFGCGSGQLLYRLKFAGFKNLKGIDPFLGNSQEVKERGFSITNDTIDDIYDKFDIIMLHHVFEHLSDPRKTLEKLNELIKDDGTLLIRIPIFPNQIWNEYGKNWFQIDPPRHFFIHSLESINILIKDLFKIDKYYYDSEDSHYVISELYNQNISMIESNTLNSKRLFKRFYKKATSDNKNNIGDQICIYLKKIL